MVNDGWSLVNYDLVGGWTTNPSEKWWSERSEWVKVSWDDDIPFPTEWESQSIHSMVPVTTKQIIWSKYHPTLGVSINGGSRNKENPKKEDDN